MYTQPNTTTSSETHHIFDPRGDLILVLLKPVKEDTKTNDLPRDELSEDSEDMPIDHTDGSGAESVAEEEKKRKTREIRMTVSSKHLTLASPVFFAMLANNFREGQTLTATGSTTVPLPEDEVEPFIILMNIVHAKNRNIPKHVNLSLLTSLAIAVDKYQFHDSVGPFAENWIDDLKNAIFDSFDSDKFQWMAIAWVFNDPAVFKYVTRSIKTNITGSDFQGIYGEEFLGRLPIPHRAIEDVKSFRLKITGLLLESYAKAIEELQSCNFNCCPDKNEDCDAMMLGYLLRSGNKFNLYPIPDAPYDHISYVSTNLLLGMITAQSFCWTTGRGHYGVYDSCLLSGSYRASESHGVKEAFGKTIRELESLEEGLRLEDYLQASVAASFR